MPDTYKVIRPKVATYKPAKAPKIEEYQGVQYDNAYHDNVDTSFYQNSIDRYRDYAEGQRQTQIGEADKQKQSALKQAYVTRMQNERKLGENLARSGIRGGATETGMLNLANQYGTARAAANTDYANSVNAINQSIDQNIFDYTNDMESRAEEYRQNMANAQWQAAREDYSNNWQAQNDRAWNVWNARNEARSANVAARNANRTAYANARTERNANRANFMREDQQTNATYYANRYSKSSKSDINKVIKGAESKIAEFNKKIKKAKTTAQKNALRAQRAEWIARKQGAAQALANK